MKISRLKWAVLSMGALLLAACSSGGGGGGVPSNTLKITTTDASGKQTQFVADSSNSVISAYTNTIENKTIIQICSDVDKDNDCSKLIIMTLDGTTAKEYATDSLDALSQVAYQDDDAENGIINHYLSTGGKIDVASVDQSVQGSFNETLECNSGCTGAVNVAGTFNIDVTP